MKTIVLEGDSNYCDLFNWECFAAGTWICSVASKTIRYYHTEISEN